MDQPKPKTGYTREKQFGPDVEVDRQELKPTTNQAELIKAAGKTMEREGLNYVGSAVVHFYLGSKFNREFSYATHFTKIEASEQVVAHGIQQLGFEAMRRYGRKVPTKRGEKL